LHDITKQAMKVLDEMGNNYVQRRVEKLASAAKVYFTERALLRDCNQIFSNIKNEAKACQSTKSLVLGIVKVIDTRILSGKEKICY
jgi:hypothetical protein